MNHQGNIKQVRWFAAPLLLLVLLIGCSNKTPEEHLTSARQHFAAGEYSAASIEAKNALQKSVQYSDARVMLGDIAYVRGDYADALSEYQRAIDLGNQSDSMMESMLWAKLRVGRVQEVLGTLQDKTDRSAEMDVVLGEALLQSGDPVAAKSLFESQPALAEAQAGLALLAWNAGDVERADKHYVKALEIEPDNRDILLRQGELYLSTKRYDDALAAFGQASALVGGQIVGRVGIVRTHLANGNLAAANTEVDVVLKQAPTYPLALYLRGLISFQEENVADAETALRQVQSRYPDHAPTQYLMGLVKYKLGQFSQAEDNLKRYLARDDSNESARKILASVRFDQGDMEGVTNLLGEVETVTQDPQLLAMLGSARLRAGDLSGATTALERAVQLAPDAAPFRNQLALTLLSAGQQERAESALKDAIDIDEGQFQSDYLIAMLRLRDGKLTEAKTSVDAIIRKSPDNPIGYNLRGAIFLAQDQRDAAREDFETALEKSPTFEPAANNLARLLEADGRTDGAQAVFNRVLESDAGNEGALVGLAEIAVRQSDVPQAISYLEKSVAENAGSLKSRLGLARLLTASGQLDDAQATIQEALDIHADHPDFLALQAQIDLRTSNLTRAERSVVKLQNLLADNPSNRALASVVAELQMRVGNRSMARLNYEKLVESSDSPPATALLRLARFDLAENKLAAARKRLTELEELGSVNPAVLQLLEADIFSAEGSMDKAAALYQTLAESGNRDGVMRLATLLFRQEKTAQGTRLLEKWLADNEADQGVRALLAGAQLSAGNSDAALVEYERLRTTGNPVVLNNLAWIYMERNDPRAVEVARQAYTAAPDNADIADTYGWVLIQQGELGEGVRVLESKALKDSNANNPTILYHLSVGYFKQGDKEKAKTTLQKALDSGDFPEREEAQQFKEELG